MNTSSQNNLDQPEVNISPKKFNPKILVGIFSLMVVVAIIIGVLALKQSTSIKTLPEPVPKPSPKSSLEPQVTPINSQITQSSTKSASTSGSKASSDQVPLAQRSYSTFVDGVVVSFDSSTNILILSTKDQPAWQIPLDSSIRLYKDKGMANIVKIQPNEFIKGQNVSVQQDAKTGKITQITVGAK